MKFSRSVIAKVGAAVLALAAAGTASVAEARSNVYFSIGANVAPGVVVGASNAPVYYPPVYAAPVYSPVYSYPAPVYVEPAPVYYGAAPVYYGAPVVGATFYFHNGHRYQHRHWNGHHYRYW